MKFEITVVRNVQQTASFEISAADEAAASDKAEEKIADQKFLDTLEWAENDNSVEVESIDDVS